MTDTVEHTPPAPPRVICSVCNWTNVGLLNVSEPGKTPVWICHGCIKRMYDERKEMQEAKKLEVKP
jgi:hypothetical protein